MATGRWISATAPLPISFPTINHGSHIHHYRRYLVFARGLEKPRRTTGAASTASLNVSDDSYQLTVVEMVRYGLQNLLKFVADFPQTEDVF